MASNKNVQSTNSEDSKALTQTPSQFGRKVNSIKEVGTYLVGRSRTDGILCYTRF